MGTVMRTYTARPSAAREWGLIAAMTVAAHPIAFVFGLALMGVSGFVGDWGLLAPPIAWVVFGMVGAVSHRDQLPGRAIRPADEPELTALVRTVAERVGFRTPLLVRLVPVPDAGLFATKVAGVRVFVLVLGWPLLRRQLSRARCPPAERVDRRGIRDSRREVDINLGGGPQLSAGSV